MCSARGRGSPTNLYFFSKNSNQFHSSDSRSIYTPWSLAWATHSRLGEIEFFKLKKGLAWATTFLLRWELPKWWWVLHKLSLRRAQARLSEKGGKWWFPLHKISLRRDPSLLRRDWRPKLSLGRDCFGLSDLGNISSFLTVFDFFLKVFPLLFSL